LRAKREGTVELERETVPYKGDWTLPPARVVILRTRHVEWDGLRSILRKWRTLKVEAETIRVDAAVRAARQFRPQLLLAAADLEGPSVVDFVGRVVKVSPESRIIVFADAPDSAVHGQLRGVPARGYLLWADVTPGTLHHALATVLETELAVESVAATEALAQAPERRRTEREEALQFTERERAVVRRLAGGLTRSEIAKAESISVRMVGRTVTDLLVKADVPNVRALVALAVKLGLGPEPPLV
jgi:DNA-binding NarL/FixJ family response regulator